MLTFTKISCLAAFVHFWRSTLFVQGVRNVSVLGAVHSVHRHRIHGPRYLLYNPVISCITMYTTLASYILYEYQNDILFSLHLVEENLFDLSRKPTTDSRMMGSQKYSRRVEYVAYYRIYKLLKIWLSSFLKSNCFFI